MNIDVKVKIDGIDQLTEAIALLGSALGHSDMPNTVRELEKIAEEKAEEPKEKVEKTQEKVKETENTLTVEEVRKVFISKNTPENRDRLKEILNNHNVKNISGLKPEDFESVMAELTEI